MIKIRKKSYIKQYQNIEMRKAEFAFNTYDSKYKLIFWGFVNFFTHSFWTNWVFCYFNWVLLPTVLKIIGYWANFNWVLIPKPTLSITLIHVTRIQKLSPSIIPWTQSRSTTRISLKKDLCHSNNHTVLITAFSRNRGDNVFRLVSYFCNTSYRSWFCFLIYIVLSDSLSWIGIF